MKFYICAFLRFKKKSEIILDRNSGMIIRAFNFIKVTTVKGFQIVSSFLSVPRLAMITAITISTVTLSVALIAGLSEKENHNSYPDLDYHSNTTAATTDSTLFTTGEITPVPEENNDLKDKLKWFLPIAFSGNGF